MYMNEYVFATCSNLNLFISMKSGFAARRLMRRSQTSKYGKLTAMKDTARSLGWCQSIQKKRLHHTQVKVNLMIRGFDFRACFDALIHDIPKPFFSCF